MMVGELAFSPPTGRRRDMTAFATRTTDRQDVAGSAGDGQGDATPGSTAWSRPDRDRCRADRPDQHDHGSHQLASGQVAPLVAPQAGEDRPCAAGPRVVGAESRPQDRQGPFGQRPGRGRLTQVLQDQARLLRRTPTAGWSGPWAASSMARARSASGRAAAGSPRSGRIEARLFRSTPTLGWSGPWAASAMARARSASGRAAAGSPRSCRIRRGCSGRRRRRGGRGRGRPR